MIGDKELQLFFDLCVGDTRDRVGFSPRVIKTFQWMWIGAVFHDWIRICIGIGALEGRSVSSMLVGGVGVLGVHGKDARKRPAGGAHVLEESIDRGLPVTVVVIGGIPVDGVCLVRGKHR